MTLPKFKFKSILVLIFISTALLMSCKDKDQVSEIKTNTVQEATLEQKKQALENFAPTSTTTVSSNGDLAINPAHGQPGHRCEIPVGAPLNGSGKTNSAPVQTEMNKAKTPAPTSGSGINPAHGQPGHRCDIKVGDPL